VRQLAPVFSTPATIVGRQRVGDTLTAHPGTAVGDDVALSYAWERCAPRCQTVASATRPTYHLGARDRGHHIHVIITAANPTGSASQTSPKGGAIIAGVTEVQTLMRRVVDGRLSRTTLLRTHQHRYVIGALGPSTVTMTWTSGKT